MLHVPLFEIRFGGQTGIPAGNEHGRSSLPIDHRGHDCGRKNVQRAWVWTTNTVPIKPYYHPYSNQCDIRVQIPGINYPQIHRWISPNLNHYFFSMVQIIPHRLLLPPFLPWWDFVLFVFFFCEDHDEIILVAQMSKLTIVMITLLRHSLTEHENPN